MKCADSLSVSGAVVIASHNVVASVIATAAAVSSGSPR